MSVGYDRVILRKMELDPNYSYDMHFKDFARMYKHYADEDFDSGRSIINYGGSAASQPQAAVATINTDDGFGGLDVPAEESSGGDGGGTEELLEQADIDALLAQMQ